MEESYAHRSMIYLHLKCQKYQQNKQEKKNITKTKTHVSTIKILISYLPQNNAGRSEMMQWLQCSETFFYYVSEKRAQQPNKINLGYHCTVTKY